MTLKKPKSLIRKAANQTGEKLEETLALIAKRADALQMRKKGHNYKEIGEALHVTAGTARKYVLDAIADSRANEEEDILTVRDLEVERLDAMLVGLWPKVLKGDTFSTQTALKVMERRAAYLGLDAPKRMEFLGAVASLTPETATKMTDEELRKRTSDLLARLTGAATVAEPEKEDK